MYPVIDYFGKSNKFQVAEVGKQCLNPMYLIPLEILYTTHCFDLSFDAVVEVEVLFRKERNGLYAASTCIENKPELLQHAETERSVDSL